MPPCFSRGIPAAECCRWVPPPSRCAGCDMPGGLRAGSPVRQGTCSGVCYAKKTYICTNTNITTMKVLLINGSPHREGNTFIALSEVARTLEAEGIGAEIVHIGTRAMQGCIACGKCAELGHCVFSDAVYTAVREKLAQADGLVAARRSIMPGRTVRFARCSTACFIRAAAIWPTSLPQPWLSAAVAGRVRRSTA